MRVMGMHRWILACLMGLGMCIDATAQRGLQQANQRIMSQKLQTDTAMRQQREVMLQDSRMMEVKSISPIAKSLTQEIKSDSTALSVRERRKISVSMVAYEDTLQTEPADSTTERYVYLLHADETRYNQFINPDAQILVGDVIFRHDSMYMYCDSALFYEKSNSLDAYGNVRMNQ